MGLVGASPRSGTLFACAMVQSWLALRELQRKPGRRAGHGIAFRPQRSCLPAAHPRGHVDGIAARGPPQPSSAQTDGQTKAQDRGGQTKAQRQDALGAEL